MPKIIEIILEVVGSVVVLAAMILIFQSMVAYGGSTPDAKGNGFITSKVEQTIADVFSITDSTVNNIAKTDEAVNDKDGN